MARTPESYLYEQHDIDRVDTESQIDTAVERVFDGRDAYSTYHLFELAESLIARGECESVLSLVRELLVRAGVVEALETNYRTPAGAILLAEAANWAAKTISTAFYAVKPAAVVAAWQMGAEFGYGEDDAYYLYEPSVGTASFHDPESEIDHLVVDVLKQSVPCWPHPWSGVTRLEQAFALLKDYSAQEGSIDAMAMRTVPPDLARAAAALECAPVLESLPPEQFYVDVTVLESLPSDVRYDDVHTGAYAFLVDRGYIRSPRGESSYVLEEVAAYPSRYVLSVWCERMCLFQVPLDDQDVQDLKTYVCGSEEGE